MSTIVKVCIIVALIGALASLGLTFVIKPKQDQLKADLATTRDTLQTTQSNLDKTRKDLDTTKKELDQTKTTLAATQADLDTARTAREKAEAAAVAAEAKARDLTAQLAAKDEQIAKIEEEKKAAGASIPELKARVDELTAQIAAVEGEKKTLADKVKQQEAEIAQLKGLDGKVVLPAGLKGRVIVYERNWNFVVIDLGRKDGLLENGELTVYRNLKYIGKVRVTAVNTRLGVANVLPEWTQAEVREGDMVIPAI